MSIPPHIIIDGHEDLAINAIADGRDYLTSAHAIRRAEAAAGFENPCGICMLGFDDWIQGRVALIVTTITAIPQEQALPGEMSYPTIEVARAQVLAQLALYKRWSETHPQIELVRDAAQFDAVIESWSDPSAPDSTRRVGLMLLMENADPIGDPSEVEWWAEQGIRMIGPAWHDNRFSGNTQTGRPLTPLGRRLLAEMERCNLTLDLTHMSDSACLEALETYSGPIVASHAHARRTVDRPRLLSDRVIEGIVARDGIIGVLPLNWALDANWKRGDNKQDVRLVRVADAIDEVCQIAGDALHAGIGSDFDGGQGAESVPAELDTIADLPKLATALKARGYEESDVDNIMAGNWARFLRGEFGG